MQLKLNKILTQIAYIQANLKQEQELDDAAIEAFKKVIDILLNSLGDLSKWIGQISDVINMNYQSASAQITDLFNASRNPA